MAFWKRLKEILSLKAEEVWVETKEAVNQTAEAAKPEMDSTIARVVAGVIVVVAVTICFFPGENVIFASVANALFKVAQRLWGF